mmetsp:Transcript_68707/g.210723  ORF Transcript_68707/g.210723 Transcript_68707/m.210723 type:complete len:211 (+) Transcript_68707:224-856(+)
MKLNCWWESRTIIFNFSFCAAIWTRASVLARRWSCEAWKSTRACSTSCCSPKHSFCKLTLSGALAASADSKSRISCSLARTAIHRCFCRPCIAACCRRRRPSSASCRSWSVDPCETARRSLSVLSSDRRAASVSAFCKAPCRPPREVSHRAIRCNSSWTPSTDDRSPSRFFRNSLFWSLASRMTSRSFWRMIRSSSGDKPFRRVPKAKWT